MYEKSQKDLLPLNLKDTKLRVSPSSLSQYGSCPFIWASKWLFCLDDKPEKDLSLAPLEKGNLTHKILEEITRKENFLFLSDSEISELIEKKLEEKITIDEEFKEPIFLYFKDLVKKFLLYEKTLREQNPERKTVGFEVEVKGAWSLEKNHLIKEEEAQKGDPRFEGFIDRLDEVGEKELEVLDYKSGRSDTFTNALIWPKKKEFQLWLYAEALNKGL